MSKQNNRGGDQSRTGKKANGNDRGKTEMQGAPAKSNRQTGGSKRHERDDSSSGADRNTTKKGANSI